MNILLKIIFGLNFQNQVEWLSFFFDCDSILAKWNRQFKADFLFFFFQILGR